MKTPLSLVMVSMMVLLGCESDQSLPASPRAGDRPVVPGTEATAAGNLESLVADIAQHVDSVPTNAPPSVARLTVVQWGGFVNMTGAPARQFAQFRANTQRAMAAAASQHQMMFTHDSGAGGLTAYELHARVMEIDGGDEWLVRWALYGPKHDASRGLIWQDVTMTRRN